MNKMKNLQLKIIKMYIFIRIVDKSSIGIICTNLKIDWQLVYAAISVIRLANLAIVRLIQRNHDCEL